MAPRHVSAPPAGTKQKEEINLFFMPFPIPSPNRVRFFCVFKAATPCCPCRRPRESGRPWAGVVSPCDTFWTGREIIEYDKAPFERKLENCCFGNRKTTLCTLRMTNEMYIGFRFPFLK